MLQGKYNRLCEWATRTCMHEYSTFGSLVANELVHQQAWSCLDLHMMFSYKNSTRIRKADQYHNKYVPYKASD